MFRTFRIIIVWRIRVLTFDGTGGGKYITIILYYKYVRVVFMEVFTEVYDRL